MTKITSETRISATDHKVELPRGDFIANADFHRDGMDLTLTAPDGHSVRIENYFSQNPQPDLVTKDGARLSPDMVDAFVPPQHPGQYAASGQIASDASPAGKITEVVGDATVTHADGTKTAATVGMPVFPGDVVQTSAKGAVNLLFADNTTFAISESARLSVDQFTYNAHDHSGSSFFSMLQGVFVYTSGLIGKHDIGSVNIETPVGSIGIRGTVVAGNIAPAGQESKITIVDGAIVVANGAGTVQMNSSLDTVSLTSYQQAPADTGAMSQAAFTQSYHAVAGVAPATFSHVDAITHAAPANDQQAPAATPDHTAPAAASDATHANAAPATGHDAALASNIALVTDATVPPPPPSASTFGTLATAAATPAATTTANVNTFSTNADHGSASTFSTTTANSATASSGVAAAPPPPPPPPAGTGIGGGTTNPPPPPHVNFTFSSWYDDTTTANDTVGLPTLMLSLTDANPGAQIVLGHVSGTNLPSDAVFQVTGTFTGNALEYTALGAVTTAALANQPVFHFDSTTGNIILDNQWAILPSLNATFHFDITAVSSTTNAVLDTTSIDLVYKDPGAHGAVQIGDSSGTSLNPSVSVATAQNMDDSSNPSAADIIVGRAGNDLLTSGGGNDSLFGDAGNDKIFVHDATFHHVDGGAGTDTLILGDGTAGAGTVFDFTQMALGSVKNIETIQLAAVGTTTASSTAILNIADVFSMTDDSTVSGGGAHTLTINPSTTTNTLQGLVTIADAASTGFRNVDGTLHDTVTGTVGTNAVMTLTGTYNGSTVTLIIHEDTGTTHLAVA